MPPSPIIQWPHNPDEWRGQLRMLLYCCLKADLALETRVFPKSNSRLTESYQEVISHCGVCIWVKTLANSYDNSFNHLFATSLIRGREPSFRTNRLGTLNGCFLQSSRLRPWALISRSRKFMGLRTLDPKVRLRREERFENEFQATYGTCWRSFVAPFSCC